MKPDEFEAAGRGGGCWPRRPRSRNNPCQVWRRRAPAREARAHLQPFRALVISTRSMEIFRAWGLEERIRAGAAEVKPYLWRTPALASSDGTEFALGYPTAAEAAAISPTRPAWAPQDHLEPLLLELLRSLPRAEVRFGCEVVDLNHAATVSERSSGGGTISRAQTSCKPSSPPARTAPTGPCAAQSASPWRARPTSGSSPEWRSWPRSRMSLAIAATVCMPSPIRRSVVWLPREGQAAGGACRVGGCRGVLAW